MELDPSNQFTKGWSWGNLKLKPSKIELENSNQLWFNLPYDKISSATIPTKNDLGLELKTEKENK